MPKPLENLTGREICGLRVVGPAPRRNGVAYWLCECLTCGRHKEVQGPNVRSGQKSCGCLGCHVKHRASNTPEYNAWCGMKARCYNKRSQDYPNYGGRGITVCNRWKKDFAKFLDDMGNKPALHYTIERRNTNGNYRPENCRWATRRAQNNNKRDNRKITCWGRKLTAAAWSRKTGIPKGAIRQRVFFLGWTPERALTTPPKVG